MKVLTKNLFETIYTNNALFFKKLKKKEYKKKEPGQTLLDLVSQTQ
jgi:hypothetical protein